MRLVLAALRTRTSIWRGRSPADGRFFLARKTKWATRCSVQDHLEKVLGTTAEFVHKHPNTARAMTAAIIDAVRSTQFT
jgi:nitrate/nitrite transport system substrate-binding protein